MPGSQMCNKPGGKGSGNSDLENQWIKSPKANKDSMSIQGMKDKMDKDGKKTVRRFCASSCATGSPEKNP